MKENDVKVKAGTDVNSIMWDMISIILEGTLDQDMEEKILYMYAKSLMAKGIESYMCEL